MSNSDSYEWRLVGTSLTAGATDPILPVTSSHFYFVLNDAGSGECSIPLKSAAASLVAEGKLAVLYYRGAIRGSFLIENIRKRHADAGEAAGQYLSMSGRGGMSLLERAEIWSGGGSEKTREFTAVTKASILRTLILEAQARGGLSTVTMDFDATNDSDSIAWTDSETYKLNVGMKLTDLVRQFADTGIDFEMNYSGTGFVLSAYKNGIGADKSATIYFRTGTNCMEVDTDQRGNDIKNSMLVAYQNGAVLVEDSTSISAYGRREEVLNADFVQTSSSATTYGAAVLATKKDPLVGRTIRVYDGVPPYIFVNYILGDTIALDIEGTVTDDRILGIQCDFDGNEYSNIVIELNSLMLDKKIKMAQDIERLKNQMQAAHDAELLEASFWAAIGEPDDVITSINAIHIIGTKVYVGGTFTRIGGINCSNFAIYDIATGQWSASSATGMGIENPTFGIICMASIGTDLYVGAGELGGNMLGKYDTLTDTWTGLDASASITAQPDYYGWINALHVIGTILYIGGNWNQGLNVNYLKYDTVGAAPVQMATHDIGIVHALTSIGTVLYIGSETDGAAHYIHQYDTVGDSFSDVGTGLDDNVYALAVLGTSIIAGGAFTGKIAEWDGAAWVVYGGGLNNTVYALAVYLTDVYAAGAFTDVGNHIAKYSGGAWWELTTGLNNTGYALALNSNDAGVDIYVGGLFTTAGDKTALNIAVYYTNFEALLDYLENSSNSFDMGAAIHNATASAITDTDEVPFWEAVANALRKITWANIKATLKTYFDTLYAKLTTTITSITSAASPYTVLATDETIILTSGSATIRLPGATGSGRKIICKVTSAGILTINADYIAGSTIDGATAIQINPDYGAVIIQDMLSTFWGTLGYIRETVAPETIMANPTASTATATDLEIAEQTLVGRIAGGHVVGLTAAQINNMIGDVLLTGDQTVAGVKSFSSAIVAGNHAAELGGAGDLEMFAPDGANPAIIQHTFGGVNGFVGFTSDGTEASPTAVPSGKVLYNVALYAYDGVNHYVNGHLKGVAAETWDATHHGIKWELWGTPLASTTEILIATIAPPTAQYKYLVSSATPFAYEESAGGLNIASGKTLAISESLTLAASAAGHTLTVPGTGVVQLADGWTPVNDTWAYTSASTITIPTDGTTTYQPGDYVRLKQGGGYKYFVLSSVTATLATVFINTDYTVANAAITDIAYCHGGSPLGWPDLFNYLPVVTDGGGGSITAYTVNSAKYKIAGRKVDFFIKITITTKGTAVGSAVVTIPITTASAGGGTGREDALSGAQLQIKFAAGGTTFQIFTYANGTPFVGNGAIFIVYGTCDF